MLFFCTGFDCLIYYRTCYFLPEFSYFRVILKNSWRSNFLFLFLFSSWISQFLNSSMVLDVTWRAALYMWDIFFFCRYEVQVWEHMTPELQIAMNIPQFSLVFFLIVFSILIPRDNKICLLLMMRYTLLLLYHSVASFSSS